MISDVLSDASAAIKEYQADFSDSYADAEQEIASVTVLMDALRLCFDSPPTCSAEHKKLLDELAAKIRNLDLSAVKLAKDRLLQYVEAARSSAAN